MEIDDVIAFYSHQLKTLQAAISHRETGCLHKDTLHPLFPMSPLFGSADPHVISNTSKARCMCHNVKHSCCQRLLASMQHLQASLSEAGSNPTSLASIPDNSHFDDSTSSELSDSDSAHDINDNDVLDANTRSL